MFSRNEVDALDPQRDGNLNIFFHVIDKKNLFGFDRGPLDGLLKDLDGWFLKPHLIGQNPFIKGPHNGKFWEDIIEVEGIGIREKTKPPSPFLGQDDLGDLDIFKKDIRPDGSKLIKGNREAKILF